MKRRSVNFTEAEIAGALGSLQQLAGDIGALKSALATRYPSVLRRRRESLSLELPFSAEPVPWYSLGFKPCQESARPSQYPLYAAGDYYLQDAGSLLALAAADADGDALQGGRLVCDLCAAPGGKASALVEAIGDAGFVLANEPIRGRLPALKYNLARTGSDRYAISCLDPDALAARLGGVFDLVLVDAPCSGQALLPRGKQTSAALSAKQILHCAARQQRILDAAQALTAPQGALIYSTCTFSEAENEAQIKRLLDQGGVAARPVERLTPYASVLPGTYRLWPHRDHCAGSFAAALNVLDAPRTTQGSRERSSDRPPSELADWLSPTDALLVRCFAATVVGWPTDSPVWLDEVAVAGPELAHRTGKTWRPSHAAAIRRVDRARGLRAIELTADQVVQYLRGESMTVSDGDGWCVAAFQGHRLGWVKVTGQTAKNHLPPQARLTTVTW